MDAVVAMDALARVGRFAPGAVLQIHGRYPRARWRRRVPGVIDLCDPRAESPMESRSRLTTWTRYLWKLRRFRCSAWLLDLGNSMQ